MNQVWETKKLGEVCGFVRGPFGGSLKKQIFVEDGFAVYEQSHAIYNQFDKIRYFIDDNKFKEMARFELKPGNLIMSCSGTMGKVAIVPNDVKQGVINQALLLLKPKKPLLNIFLKYWIESNGFQKSLKAYSLGAAIQNVASVKTLKEIQVSIPHIPEQKRIVKILDEAFATIDKAKANAKKNLQNSRELFDSCLNEVFANQGEDWEEKKIYQLGVVKTGTTPKTSQKENFGNYIPFIKPAVFNSDGSICYDTEGLSEIGLKKSRHIAEKSILMVCIGATIGKTGFTEKSISCNQQINSLTTKAEYYSKFFYYAMLTKSFQADVIKNSGQATLPIINKTKWSNLTIRFPKGKEHQKQFSDRFDKLTTERKKLEANYQQKLTDLEELKKAILQKAFNGEL